MLTLQLFGIPAIWRNGQPITIARRKSRGVLFYLAMQLNPVSRERLLELFWFDHERPAAQQSLRTTLHGLRQALGTDLEVHADLVGLAESVEVDARRFAATLGAPALGTDQLVTLLALYRGELLADLDLPDSEPFNRWLLNERERFTQLALRGYRMLAATYETQHNYHAALETVNRALVWNQLQEDLQRTAIRLLYLAGDRVGAIRRYEQLRDLLDTELGVPPMPETRLLYDAIITDSLNAPPPLAPPTPLPRMVADIPSQLRFTGRDRELQQLQGLLGATRMGVIEGEPGIGKTRLAKEFLQRTGWLVLAGSAYELEYNLPFQLLTDALRGLVRQPAWPSLQARMALHPIWWAEIIRLLPELTGTVPADPTAATLPANESRLWEGIRQLLQALSLVQPTILFLDDLHWADDATLALLGYLVRQAHPQLLFLATTRPPTPRSALTRLLHALAREGRIERLVLPRLSQTAMVELARSLSPTYTYPLAQWIAHNTEGNPYMLEELIHYAYDEGLLGTTGTLNLERIAQTTVVPQTVYSLVQSRLDRLSGPARQVLDVGVAVGREFAFDLVAHATGLDEPTALDALDELRTHGLIHPLDGKRYVFDHTITMEVAYREVGEPRHRMLHRRVAESLEQSRPDHDGTLAGLIAAHYHEGDALELAAPYALRAGKQATAVTAWHEAIAFFELALRGFEASGGFTDQRIEVLMALSDAQLQSGASAQATETLQKTLRLIDPNDEQRLSAVRLALAQALLPQARYVEVIALALQMITSADPRIAASGESIWGAALSLEGADLEGAIEHLRRAERLRKPAAHTDCTDPVGLAQVRFELANVLAQQGDLVQAIAYYRESLAAAQSTTHEGALTWRILAHNNLAYHLHLLGDSEAQTQIQAGMQLAEARGIIALRPYLYSTSGEIALAAGDLAAAEQLFTQGLNYAESVHVPERIAGLHANLGLVALRRGDRMLALHRLSSALVRADTLGTRHLAAQIRIWIAPLLPPAEAQTYLAEARILAEAGGRKRLIAELDGGGQ